jgi:putative cardiolipin synthase
VTGPVPRLLQLVLLAATVLVAACATLPPGLDAPKPVSSAFAQPETTALGKRFDALARKHAGRSGFYLLTDGRESFATRLSIADKAERTLDVQYFVVQQDVTGQLLLGALLAAADRGVRVRLLLDDELGIDGGTMIRPLAAHPNIEIRVFNPFVARRDFALMRGVEHLLRAGRLNYRMHNKLFIGDNAVAVSGGRNIGDEYFQASTESQFGDIDLAVVGPMVRQLSQSFDVYWNDRLAVPVQAQPLGTPSAADLEACRKALAEHKQNAASSEYVRSIPKHDPLAAMTAANSRLVWAKAMLAYDTPDKASTVNGDHPGRLMWKRVAAAAAATTNELVIVSPYVVPGESEMALIRHLREQGVRVRILTNSLASTNMPIVHTAYRRYRVPLLQMGVELYEVRPQSGQQATNGLVDWEGSDALALHAKVFVFDRERVFVGSMNFDQRSLRINTELGLIVDSPQLARDLVARFDSTTQPTNSFRLLLDPPDDFGAQIVRWVGVDGGHEVSFDTEPDVDDAQRALIESLSWLRLDGLL